MAASHQFDIRKYCNKLHQETVRLWTLETEIPKEILGRERTVGFPHSGVIQKFGSSFTFIIINKGDAYYNAYEKDIAMVNIFFGGSTVFGEEMFFYLYFYIHFPFFRVWEVSKDDLAGLHLKSGWTLWALPWSQLRINDWTSVLVPPPVFHASSEVVGWHLTFSTTCFVPG